MKINILNNEFYLYLVRMVVQGPDPRLSVPLELPTFNLRENLLKIYFIACTNILRISEKSLAENIHLPRVCDDMNHYHPDLLVPAPRSVVLVDHLGSRLSVPFQFSVFNLYFSPSRLKIRLTSWWIS